MGCQCNFSEGKCSSKWPFLLKAAGLSEGLRAIQLSSCTALSAQKVVAYRANFGS